MTTFKEIRGTAIESVSSDPSNPEEGQIWYNNTIGVLKGYQLVAAAWAAGGNINTTRRNLAGFWNTNCRSNCWWFCTAFFNSYRKI